MNTTYQYLAPKEDSYLLWTKLTGNQRVTDTRPTDDVLAANLKLAADINDKVNQCVLYAPNYTSRGHPQQDVKHMQNLHLQLSNAMNQSKSQLSREEWYKSVAHITQKYGVGTCGAMSIVGGILFKKDNTTRMSLCIIPNGNHQVIRIGEGASAVVCDPWSKCYYPEDRCNLYLREVSRFMSKDGYPFVNKTNKKLQEALVLDERFPAPTEAS